HGRHGGAAARHADGGAEQVAAELGRTPGERALRPAGGGHAPGVAEPRPGATRGNRVALLRWHLRAPPSPRYRRRAVHGDQVPYDAVGGAGAARGPLRATVGLACAAPWQRTARS